MSLIFSNLVVIKTLSSNHRMYNLYAKFVKILEICKQFSENLVNDSGNVPRRGPVPKFSDLEVVALSLTAETESIDSEKWLFDYKLQEYKDSIPNLISRRQFNDRRKKTSGLCEELRKRIAMEMDGGEEQFFVDSKPIEVCRVARGKRCKMGRAGNFSQAPDIAVQLGRKPAPVAKTSESVTAPAEPQQDNPNPPHASAPSVLIVPSLIEKGQESGIDPFTAHQVGQ